MRVIDTTLQVLRWPSALLALLLLPGAGYALWETLQALFASPGEHVPFLTGLLGYLLAWRLLFRRRFLGSVFPTIEHELTHALFAWLTGHRVTGFSATWSRGGHVRIAGGTNWLILLAPYFFPTLSALAIAALWLVPTDWLYWTNVVLGASVSYQLISTVRETHLEQPDLKQAGFLFSACILPTTNALAMGFVLGFVTEGSEGAASVFRRVGSYTLAMVSGWL